MVNTVAEKKAKSELEIISYDYVLRNPMKSCFNFQSFSSSVVFIL